MKVIVKDPELAAELLSTEPTFSVDVDPQMVPEVVHFMGSQPNQVRYCDPVPNDEREDHNMAKNKPATQKPTAQTAPATSTPPVPPQPTAPPAAAPAPPPKDQRNGVTRPKAGTTTGRVWDEANAISSTEGRAATRAEVLTACSGEHLSVEQRINVSTVATQYGKWRRYWGLSKERVAKPAPATQAPPTGGTPVNPAPQASPVAPAAPDGEEPEVEDEAEG